MKRNRINLRVSDRTWERLKLEAHRHETTMTAIIETALVHYFHPDRVDQHQNALLSRLDQLSLGQDRMETDVRVCLETLGQFIFYWLTQTEPIPDPERDAAHSLGRRRYDFFIDQVAKKITERTSLTTQVLGQSQPKRRGL